MRWVAMAVAIAIMPVAIALDAPTEFHLPASLNGHVEIESAGHLTLTTTRLGTLDGMAAALTWHRLTVAFLHTQDGDILDGQGFPEQVDEQFMGTFHDTRFLVQNEGRMGLTVLDGTFRFNASKAVLSESVGRGSGPNLSPRVAPEPATWDVGPVAQASVAFEFDLQWGPEIRGDPTLILFGLSGQLHHSDGVEELSSGMTVDQDIPEGGIRVVTYDVLTTTGLSLTASGTDLVGGAVGAKVTASIDGLVSLPLVDGGHAEGTWEIRGKSQMADIRPAGPNRATATVLAEDGTILVDSQPFFASAANVGALSGAIGAVALLTLLWKTLPAITPLLTRLPPGKALENKNRRKLFDYIVKAPGATFREVLRGTGIPAGTARHHLTVMVRSDMIVEHGHRSTLRYFENHGKFDRGWKAVVFLREPDLAKVHKWVESHPDEIQKDLLEHAEARWGWSRSTTQHRLTRLVDAGLITYRQAGRKKFYRIAEDEPERRPGIWA